MVKSCYLCNREFSATSLKTARLRFKTMGLTPPDGMGEADRVCSKCLKKIHDEEMKRVRHEPLQRKIFYKKILRTELHSKK